MIECLTDELTDDVNFRHSTQYSKVSRNFSLKVTLTRKYRTLIWILLVIGEVYLSYNLTRKLFLSAYCGFRFTVP